MFENIILYESLNNIDKDNLIQIIIDYLNILNEDANKKYHDNEEYNILSKNIKLTLKNRLEILITTKNAMMLDNKKKYIDYTIKNDKQSTINDGFDKINKQLSEYDNLISDLKIISNFFKDPFNYQIEPDGKNDFEIPDNSGAERNIVEVLFYLANKLEDKNDDLKNLIFDINQYIK